MQFPFVGRTAFEAVREERNRLLGELHRVQEREAQVQSQYAALLADFKALVAKIQEPRALVPAPKPDAKDIATRLPKRTLPHLVARRLERDAAKHERLRIEKEASEK